jgi:hypothetical protein
MAPQKEAEFIPILRKLYTSIQSQEGDQRLRERLSAERVVTVLDNKMSPSERQAIAAALDLIEKELLP